MLRANSVEKYYQHGALRLHRISGQAVIAHTGERKEKAARNRKPINTTTALAILTP